MSAEVALNRRSATCTMVTSTSSMKVPAQTAISVHRLREALVGGGQWDCQ